MRTRILTTLLLCLMLSACSERVELHSQLSEHDANDVVAELADKHIRASKRIDKNGITVLVDDSDMNRAIRALDAVGLPRRARTSLGEIFKKEGVISTPMEERARYIYALSQELESTLSQMDGVITARVHVVLPERVAPGEPVQPASASVFIKHSDVLDPDSTRPRVRHLVASGIPGMANEAEAPGKLSVIFSPSAPYQDEQRLVYFGPFLIPEADESYWRTLFYGSLIGFFVLLASAAVALNPGLRNASLHGSKNKALSSSNENTRAANVVAPPSFTGRAQTKPMPTQGGGAA